MDDKAVAHETVHEYSIYLQAYAKASPVDNLLRIAIVGEMKRIGIRDLAKHCGLAVSTVSHALRGDGTVSASTRERVKSAAEALGYVPDPILSSLATKQFRRAPHRKGVGIAFYECWPKGVDQKAFWSAFPIIKERANRLGYWAEHINGNNNPQGSSLSRKLHTRGIGAIILGNIQASLCPEPFDWMRFSTVCYGNNPYPFPLHRVCGSPFHSFRRAWMELRKCGFERIGAVLCRHEVEIEDDPIRHGAYLECLHRDSGRHPIPPYLGMIDDKEAYLRWYRKHKPDVVLAFGILHWWLLREAGLDMDRIPIALLHLLPEDLQVKDFAGIVSPDPVIAINSVDLIDKLIHHREVGLPETPMTLHCSGEWRQGTTLL